MFSCFVHEHQDILKKSFGFLSTVRSIFNRKLYLLGWVIQSAMKGWIFCVFHATFSLGNEEIIYFAKIEFDMLIMRRAIMLICIVQNVQNDFIKISSWSQDLGGCVSFQIHLYGSIFIKSGIDWNLLTWAAADI